MEQNYILWRTGKKYDNNWLKYGGECYVGWDRGKAVSKFKIYSHTTIQEIIDYIKSVQVKEGGKVDEITITQEPFYGIPHDE